jgi:ribosomal protein L37AE/L43A
MSCPQCKSGKVKNHAFIKGAWFCLTCLHIWR